MELSCGQYSKQRIKYLWATKLLHKTTPQNTFPPVLSMLKAPNIPANCGGCSREFESNPRVIAPQFADATCPTVRTITQYSLQSINP
jgi:hypothetical protein